MQKRECATAAACEENKSEQAKDFGKKEAYAN